MAKSKKQKGGKFRQTQNVSATALSYRGPIISPASREEADTLSTLVGITGTVGSSAGGVFASWLTNSITSAPDWTGLIADWAEFRILGTRLEYFPWNRYSKVTTTTTPAIVAVDRAGVPFTPASYAQLMSYSSAEKKSLEDPWFIEARMDSAEEAQFISTASTSVALGFPAYADGLSVSTTFGRYFQYWLVQFRGRK